MNLTPFATCLILGSAQTIAMTSSTLSIYNNNKITDLSGTICPENIYNTQLTFLILACVGIIFGALLLLFPNLFSSNEWKIVTIILTFVWLAVTVTSSILTHQVFNRAAIGVGSPVVPNPKMKHDTGFSISYVVSALLIIISIIYCFM